MAEKEKMLFQRDLTSPREEDLEVAMSVSPSPDSFWRPTKGLLSLLSINLVVCSVEMVASCSFTFIPPLLLRSQFSEFVMNIILGIGPLIAVVTVPAFAAWSDQSSRSFQRRRLLIFWCLLALTAALVLIPSSHRISFLLLGDPTSRLQMFILATGVILLDYIFKVIFNPCEALLSVVMASYSKGSQTLGFTMHSACMSLGCIIGFLIVCVEWTAVFGLDLHQDQMCFLVAIVLLMPCVVVMRPNKGLGPKPQNLELPLKCDMAVNSRNSFVKNVTQTRLNNNHEAYQVPMTNRTIFRKFSVSSVAIYVSVPFAKFLKTIIKKLIYIVGKILFVPIECYSNFRCSPSVIQRMFMFEIFGWTAVLCHDRFLTDFFGQYVFKGDPNAGEGSTQAKLYDEGIRIGSWSLFLQSVSACLYAFFLQQHLMRLFGPRIVFLGGIFVFFLCMVLTATLSSVASLEAATAFSGIGTAALTTTPTMLVTLYFREKNVYMRDVLSECENGSRPERGIGTEVAVLDMAFYLSQVLLSFLLGPLMQFFKSSIVYIVVSAVTSAMALYCASRVVFNSHDFNLVMENKF